MSSAAIPSPGLDEVAVGPLTFHVYGLLYVVAILAAVLITRRRWRRAGHAQQRAEHDCTTDIAEPRCVGGPVPKGRTQRLGEHDRHPVEHLGLWGPHGID